MNTQTDRKPAPPDFSTFGLAPHFSGQLVDVSVKGADGGRVKGLLLRGPTGRVLSLTISHRDGLDFHEGHHLDRLIERCGEGNWMLEGLQRVTEPGSYAEMLIVDAIAAGCAA